MPTLRGTDWRGKDCNDFRDDVYPGRKPIDYDVEYDSNCNGIYVSIYYAAYCSNLF